MEIQEVSGKKDLDRFIELPFRLYRENSLYAPPLRRELREQFSSANPFFRHAESRYFLASRGKKILGRVASIVNHLHLDIHRENVGFFGFFESIDDPGVSRGLLKAVQDDLAERGMTAMRGPLNFSTNDECGVLIEGFDAPPMIMTPYNPPYYEGLMEAFGLRKCKDLFAYLYEVQERLPEKILRVAEIASKRGLTVRPVEKKRFREEMLIFRDVYNSAWEKNWGFIPLTEEEVVHMGSKLKQVMVPELTLVAEDRGRPVGFLGLLPDFNEVLRHMGGRLTPVSLAKALYYSRRISGLRLLLFGIKEEYRNKGVDALLLREGYAGIRRGRYRKVEFSWILEDNIPVQRIVDMVGGRLYKRYRIFEKSLL